MSRQYWTICTRETTDSGTAWFPQFGDYDYATVKQELRDCYPAGRIVRHTLGPNDQDDGSLTKWIAENHR